MSSTPGSDGSDSFGSENPMDRPPAECVEESPTMRSVAMMSGGPALAGPIGGPKFGKAPPLGGFGKPPPLGISRPSFDGARKLSRSGGPSTTEVFGVKKEWTGVVSPCVWNVKGEDLEMVPLDFPLERTSREIFEDATTVASRISDALGAMSIEAEYDDTKARAKCKTSDLVKFRIRLYAGGENGQPVAVEVQRRSGSASCFMRSCRAILDAAEGRKAESDGSTPNKIPPFKKPIGEMKCLQGTLPNAAEAKATALSALDNVMTLLRSNKRDSNLLGLENLCFLVDPTKSLPLGALEVSKCVVLGDEKYDIREEIRVLTERDVFSPEFDEEEGPSDYPDQVRYLALRIFARALGICSKDGCLASAIQTQKWFSDYLVPSLIDELKRCEESTNSASQAASCVQSLISCSEVARRLVIENRGVDVLQNAREFGKLRHHLLSLEVSRCLDLLDARVAGDL